MLMSLFRITLTTVVALFFISLCLIAWFLSTTEGNREIASIAAYKDSRISVNITQGNLLSGIKATDFKWNDDKFSLAAAGIDSSWNILCLLQQRFCAEKIFIDQLEFTSHKKPKNKPGGKISLPAVKLPLALEFRDLKINRLLINYSADEKPLLIRNIHLQAQSEGDEVTIEHLSLNVKNLLTRGSGTIKLTDDYPLALQLDAIIENLVDEQDLSISSNLTGTLAALKLDVMTLGVFDSNITGTSNTLDPDLPSDLHITWKQNQWSLVNLDKLYLRDGDMHVYGDLNGLQTIIDMRIAGDKIPDSHINLQGRLSKKGYQATNIELSTLNGTINGEMDINWSEQFKWSSNLYFKDINTQPLLADYPGKLAGNLRSHGKLYNDGSWELQIEPAVIQGQLRGLPLHAHAIFRYDRQNWQIESLRLASKDNNLQINGVIDKNWKVSGDIALNAIESLFPDAAGAINGKFSVEGELTRPSIRFDLNSRLLTYQDTSVSKLNLNGEIKQLGFVNSHVELNARGLAIDENQFRQVKFNLHGNRDKHVLTLSGHGPNDTSLQTKLSGSVKEDFSWSGQLSDSTFVIPQHRFQLVNSPILKVNFTKKHLTLQAHCWRNRLSRLCLKEDLIATDKGEAIVSLRNYELSQLNSFFPINTHLSGKTSVDTIVSWGKEDTENISLSLKAGVSNGTITVQKPQTKEKLSFVYKTIFLDADASKNQIRADLKLDSKDLGKAQLSLQLDPRSRPIQIKDGQIDFKDFELSFLQSLITNYEKIAGTVSANGKITGAINAPEFQGNIVLDNPQIQAPQLPLSITGGRIVTRINGNKLKLSGNLDSGNGHIKLSGTGDFQDSSQWQANINAKGESLVLSQKPLFESVVAPDIRIQLTPGHVNIGGQITIVAAAINIKEIPDGATVPSSDIIIINQPTTERLDEEHQWTTSTDLQVILGKAVRLSGYGVRARLAGDFNVKKDGNDALQLFGEVTIPEGIYKSYGQDLKIENGQVLLVGPSKQTALDIAAYRDVDDIRAGLLITGTVTNPIVNLYSEPNMEHERILAYIVLGRDITAGDNNDSNVLATAALSMGISNGRGLATNIAEAFGIREFNIEASGRGEDTQVLLSGRLSSRLMIRYGIGVFTPVNTLFLRYDLGRKLYLETAQGLERAVDLFYSIVF